MHIEKLSRGEYTNMLKNKLKTIKWNLFALKKFRFKCRGNSRVIVFGTPDHGNIGDHLIAYSQRKLLETQYSQNEIIEVPRVLFNMAKNLIKELINENDRILITGGGLLGSFWIDEHNFICDVIKTFPNHKIIIFPETIFFLNDNAGQKLKEQTKKIFLSHQNLIICAREKSSYQMFCSWISSDNVYLMPDMSLYLDKSICESSKKSGVLLCFRSDIEGLDGKKYKKWFKQFLTLKNEQIVEFDTVLDRGISERQRNEIISEIIRLFGSKKCVITDRLHGMLFAYITKSPCIAFDNASHKISGVYNAWLKQSKHVCVISKDIAYEDLEILYTELTTSKSKIKHISYEPFFNELLELLI